MNREEIFYLIPYLLSLVLSAGIFLYTWRHRYVRGARMYAWYMGGQTLTALGFILELISPDLQTKILWDKFQWLTDSFLVIIPVLIFSVQFSEYKLRHPRFMWGYWIGTPILFTLILLTDNIHHLVYPNPHLSSDYPFPELQYNFTYVVYAYALLYIYTASIVGISFLIRRAIQPYNAYRLQYWTIILGFLIPLLFTIFSLTNIRITPQRDIAPFSFALGNLIVAWGLFRYRLFDIVPIARERIVEDMVDPVMVLDINNRVVDINPAALASLGTQTSDIIGHSANEVFADWPITVDELASLDMKRKEVAVTDDDGTFFYDLNISPIKDKTGRLLGRILVARDVTRHKTLESGYRSLSEELEQRVNTRTEELRQVAELYRAVVENQTEFIIRWKPDGTRIFVNDAYCRYFGVTYNQALSSSFMPLIVEEDRPAVEEKILRLKSGEANAETEVHRVIKRDGSIGWQEWTDQAIRDEAGNLTEFLSVGRDVTERKLAEETKLKQLAFDELMTRILASFATCTYKEVDDRIVDALYESVKFFGGDFADIFQLAEDKKTWCTTHYWMSPQVQQSERPSLSIPVGTLKWSEGVLLNGGVVKLNSLDDYPAEAYQDKKFSEKEGVKSLLSVPIRGRELSVTGAMDIISYTNTNHVDYTNNDITHLKLIGDSIANLLERKRAETALLKSEMKHRLLFESADDSIFIMKDGIFVDCNPKTLDMFSCHRDDIIGKTPFDFSPAIQPDGKDSQEKGLENLEAALRGKPQFFEWRHCRLDKKPFEAEVSLSLLELSNEAFIQAIVRDITERKQAEDALRKSEERFAKAFKTSPVIITISQLSNATLLEVNDTFEKISGYKREEVIGKSTMGLSLWTNPEDRDRVLRKVSESGEIRNEEFQFKTRNGDVIIGLLSAELIELDGEACLISVIEDISERKKAEERILRLNRLYATISQINQTIVHAHNTDILFKEICRVAIDHGQFRMAWIGLINETGEQIEPVVFAGEEEGYLTNVKIDFHDKISGNGPTGTAIREGRCITCQDIATDPRMVPWKEQALRRGYLSSAAVPFRRNGRVVGALSVYAGQSHGFDAENEELLEQIGQDISFAIDSIDHETERLRAEKELADAYDTTLEGWARALELRDKETEGHSRRVTETTLTVGRAMGFDEEELVHIRRGSLLHDIGKMGIPDDILRKEGPLTDEERKVVVKHPTTAHDMLKPISYLEKAMEIPYCHHEKWDGTGYPRGLRGEKIPLAARIFAVVDVWDALSSDRPYRSAWSRKKVVRYLIDESGTHFDPQVVRTFLQMMENGEI